MYNILIEDHDKDPLKIARTYIEENYAGKITLEDVAAQIPLSPEAFSSLFKMNMGISLQEYVRLFRMEKAREFLKNPALKIYEISFLVGYPDPTHFCRSFEEVFDISPAEYRRLL